MWHGNGLVTSIRVWAATHHCVVALGPIVRLLHVVIRHSPSVVADKLALGARILVAQDEVVSLVIDPEPIEAPLQEGVLSALMLPTDASVAFLQEYFQSLLRH